MIYIFFQFLINYFSGERVLIIMIYGWKFVYYVWFLNYVLFFFDIFDLYIFFVIKCGILQYVWFKFLFVLVMVIMKVIGIFYEGRI